MLASSIVSPALNNLPNSILRKDVGKSKQRPANTNENTKTTGGANIYRFQNATDLHYESFTGAKSEYTFRDAVCALCEKTVAVALNIPLASLQARTRCGADVALARQIAMYLCHTTFSLLLTEIGLYFKRDRTTVSYACALIEDKRDDIAFDVTISQLEALLFDAKFAMSLCVAEMQPPLADDERCVGYKSPRFDRQICGHVDSGADREE